jgi:hypothetical protein
MSEHMLLLVSLGPGAVSCFVGGDPSGKSLAFIPTARRPYTDRSFIERGNGTRNR